ncbi:MAG TPA: arginase family protein, partial [Micromonosporaceae bacterium]
DRDSYDEELLAKHPDLVRFTDRAVRADPAGVAQQAVDAISATAGSVVVHFDVDAVDSGDLPLADFPNYGAGVSLAAAGEVLRTLYSVPGLAAIVLTEVNPTHDADSSQLDRYIATVSSAMSGLAHS